MIIEKINRLLCHCLNLLKLLPKKGNGYFISFLRFFIRVKAL